MAILTSDRRITWEGNVGISGGIPNRTTIYTTLSAGASTAAIQAALSACPANQVVKLAAGTYTLTTYVDWNGVNSGVVLRGAGPTTIINQAAGAYFYMKSIFAESALSVDANLSANATKDGTTLTLSSVPSWVTVGDLICIDQLDDSSFVAGAGTEGGQSYREILGNGARGLGQMNRVTAKTATTITLETPLYYGFTTAQTAQIFQPGYNPSTNGPLTGCGIEDMTINGTTTSSFSNAIKMETCDSCWVKNVEINNMNGGAGIITYFCYRGEIRHNHIHDSHTQDAGQGYGVALYHVSCGFLIEDNIFRNLHNAQTINYGSSGNAYAYNYEASGTSVSNQNPGMNTHGVHCYMNLFEGNYCQDKVLADWTHGSSSHNTVFRCRVTGDNYTGNLDNYCTVSVEYYNRYWNIVGNVLGTAGQQNKYLQDSGSTSQGSQGSIIKVGGEVNAGNDFSPADANSYTSGSFILIHGNYDTVTASQHWDSNVADHVLPNSCLYSSAPAFFASLAWPPFDPASPGGATATRIPAGYRYVNGQDPSSHKTIEINAGMSETEIWGTAGNSGGLVHTANNGDTVHFAAGDYHITTTDATKVKTISKSIRLVGDGATGGSATRIITDVNVAPDGITMIQFNLTKDLLLEITGICFKTGTANGSGAIDKWGALRFLSNNTSIPNLWVHHCRFEDMQHWPIFTDCCKGVFSKNQWIKCEGMAYTYNLEYQPNPPPVNASDWGDGSWASPSSVATDNAMYYEDNYFDQTGTAHVNHVVFDGTRGGRVVARYNTFNCVKASGQPSKSVFSCHGLENRNRSIRNAEFYNNNVKASTSASVINQRGGTLLVFNNRVGTFPSTPSFKFQQDRHGDPGLVWGRATGTNPYDINDTSAGGTNSAPTAIATFTAGALSTNDYITGSPDPVSILGAGGSWVGYSVSATNKEIIIAGRPWPERQYYGGVIESHTTNTLTIAGATFDPQYHAFASGDTIKIYRCLHSMDMIGRAGNIATTGVDNTLWYGGGVAANPPHPPDGVSQPNSINRQSAEPFYCWNNKIVSSGAEITAQSSGFPQIREGTHFINGVVKPNVAGASAGNGWFWEAGTDTYCGTNYTSGPPSAEVLVEANRILLHGTGAQLFGRGGYVYPHPLTSGTLPPPVGPIWSAPTTHAFGNVVIGTSPSPSFDIVISNTGDQPFTVSVITWPTGYSMDVSEGGFTILGGDSHTKTLVFTPTLAQAYNGDVSFTTNIGGTTIKKMAVTGAGVTQSVPPPPPGGRKKKKNVLISRF